MKQQGVTVAVFGTGLPQAGIEGAGTGKIPGTFKGRCRFFDAHNFRECEGVRTLRKKFGNGIIFPGFTTYGIGENIWKEHFS
ncbi:MAG: hypothetical protein C6W57_08540 [Caldibacillus debilis]|nr:MAG: hypothetical protein C6W57_08540 [Caldibacillus debilis]